MNFNPLQLPLDPLDPRPEVTATALSQTIHYVQTIDSNGANIVGRNQAHALHLVLEDASKKFHGVATGRHAYGIDVGGGKSTAIAAFIATQFAAGAINTTPQSKSVAVATSQIEALCKMKRKLLQYGVPANLIGLSHSYAFDPKNAGENWQPTEGHASEPANTLAELAERPILLASHAKAKGGSAGANAFATFQDFGKRGLVFWDEGLLAGKGLSLSFKDFSDAVKLLDDLPADGVALPFLRAAKSAMNAEIAAQEDPDREAQPLALAADADLEKIDSELRAHTGNSYVKKAIRDAREFVELAAQEMTVVRLQSGEAAIAIKIELPPEIDTMIILDASGPIRVLVEMDKSIHQVDLDAKLAGPIKTYENVTVNCGRVGSGKNSTQRDIGRAKGFNQLMVREAVAQAKAEDESVLIVTFKADNERDYVQTLKKSLGKLATAKTSKGKPLVHFTTWGRHDSLNDFAHCGHVVLAGVLHLPDDYFAAAMAAQIGVLERPDLKKLRAAKFTEVAHAMYQAIGRGRARYIDDGKAGAMTIWCATYNDDPKPYLKRLLPGAVWNDAYVPEGYARKNKVTTNNPTAADKDAAKIVEFLKTQTAAVTSKAVREALAIEPRAYTRARPLAEANASGWRVEGLKWVPDRA